MKISNYQKCGHLNGKKLVTTEELVQKIKAIKEVAPSLYIVARTDARGVEGLDEAIERANAYVKAGADAIFLKRFNQRKNSVYLIVR